MKLVEVPFDILIDKLFDHDESTDGPVTNEQFIFYKIIGPDKRPVLLIQTYAHDIEGEFVVKVKENKKRPEKA